MCMHLATLIYHSTRAKVISAHHFLSEKLSHLSRCFVWMMYYFRGVSILSLGNMWCVCVCVHTYQGFFFLNQVQEYSESRCKVLRLFQDC